MLSRLIGDFDSLMFINNTPVEDGITKVWTGSMVKSGGAVATESDIANARAYQDASRRSFEQDFDIWANKAPCLKVLRVPTDGPYHRGRKWYSQFFRTREQAQEIWQITNGVALTKGYLPVVAGANTENVMAAPFRLYEPA